MSRARILGMVTLGLVLAVAQGLVVFWWWFGEVGPFLSLAGLKATVIPLAVEGVVAIVAAKELHDMHGRNPQAHGAARPASEAEAQAAARGKAKPAPVHDQRFPE